MSYLNPPPPPPGAMPPPPPPPPPPGMGQFGQAGQDGDTSRPKLASWGIRLGGFLLDLLFVSIVQSIILVAVSAAVPKEIGTCTVNGQLELCKKPTSGGLAIIYITTIAMVAIYLIVYRGILVAKNGGTFGQRIVGVRVANEANGANLSPGQAIGRAFATLLSTFACYLGFLWPLWDSKKQTWHDKLSHSLVVMRNQ